MLLVLDLGFSSLVLVVCAVFVSLIVFAIRSQWQQSTARKQEIKRLMILASQEASRAELEFSVSYSYPVSSSVLVPQRPQCAVCFFPTTRRCSQCKAVQYCSGKCQIAHWRQGHKDECRPPISKSYIDLKPKEDGQNESYSNALENGGSKYPTPASMSHYETIQTDSDCYAEASLMNHSEIEGNPNAKRSFESSDARFSGFTDSSTINESSDDASLSESVGSDDSGKSDYTENHLLRTSSVTEDVKQWEDVPPKFASLVNSPDISCSSDLSGLSRQTAYSNGRADGKSTESSSQGTGCLNNGSIVEPSAASSDFWESALGPTKTTTRNHASVLPNSEKAMVEKMENGSTISSSSFKNRKSPGKSSDPCSDLAFQTLVQARSQAISDAAVSSIAKMASLRGDSSDTRSTSVSDFHRVFDTSIRSSRASETKPETAPLSQRALSTSSIAKNCLSSAGRVAAQLKGSVMSRQCSLRSSDFAGRYNEGLFPYEVFVKLYTWKEVELHPCGLINCGNSCYANAVLQCLAFTPPLTAFFLQGLHSKACRKNDWCFMCDFEALLLKAKQSESAVSPINIVSQLENIGSQLSTGRQEDAHEFLRCTIDAMERICLKESRVMPDSTEADTTLIGLTFGGYLQSKIRCGKCQGKFERHERMMDLTVEVEGDIKTLEEALQRFTLYEILDGENKYKCSRCGSYEKAKKKLTILEAPNILTITLKLYQSGKYGKINKSIKFPEILNLAPYMSGTSDKSPIYRLYGVIVHLGFMSAAVSGHYICYVKNPRNKWFKIDDSKVTPVDKETVFAAEAYMLLYSRCSPRSPRSIRNKIMSSNPTLTISKLSASSFYGNSISSNGLHGSRDPPFDSRYHHELRPVLEEDSSLSSDNSSIFSSNSDEGSSSTDGTRDSTCSDDLSEYFFGQNSASSSSSPSSPPLYGRTGEEAITFSHFDTTKLSRKLVHSRETKSGQLARSDGFDGVNSGIICRKSTMERKS